MLSHTELDAMNQMATKRNGGTCGGLGVFVKFVKVVAFILLFQMLYMSCMLVFGTNNVSTPVESTLNSVNETAIYIRIMENVTSMLNVTRSFNQTFINEFK